MSDLAISHSSRSQVTRGAILGISPQDAQGLLVSTQTAVINLNALEGSYLGQSQNKRH